MSNSTSMASALLVEVANTSPPWLPWLPVLGSLIVATAAVIGILVSNQTNRDAIAAADDREWVRWRREKLFDLAGEIITTSSTCTARLGGCPSWDSGAKRELTEINNINTGLRHTATRLRLVTDDLDLHADAIYHAVWDLFVFVGENYSRIKQELARDERGTFDRIADHEKHVADAQQAFIQEVRRVSFALGPQAT